MYDISKELLSEVLGINDIVHVQKEGSCSIFISRANNPAYIISINDLFFKCKEWASSKKFELFSAKLRNCYNCCLYGEYGEEEDFNSTSEQQAVFKACQWILEQKGKIC